MACLLFLVFPIIVLTVIVPDDLSVAHLLSRGLCGAVHHERHPQELWNEVPVLAPQSLKLSEASLLAPTVTAAQCATQSRAGEAPTEHMGAVHSPLASPYQNGQDQWRGLEKSYGSNEDSRVASLQGMAGERATESRSNYWCGERLAWGRCFLKHSRIKPRRDTLRLAVVGCPWPQAAGQESFFSTGE